MTIIYTYWQSKNDSTPPPLYLRLCMLTWEKYIPNLKIEIINHSNLESYVGGIYDIDKLKKFTLPMQSDAVSAAVLATKGGIFFDIDTIVTKDISEFLEVSPRKLVAFGNPNRHSMHLAVLKCEYANNKLVLDWMNEIKQRINHKEEKYDWSYLGNGIINSMMKEGYYNDYLILDRTESGNILESKYGSKIDPREDYVQFYFNNENNIDLDYLLKSVKFGLISLHNSWTPLYFKNITTRKSIYNSKTLLARILFHLIENRKYVGFTPNAYFKYKILSKICLGKNVNII